MRESSLAMFGKLPSDAQVRLAQQLESPGHLPKFDLELTTFLELPVSSLSPTGKGLLEVNGEVSQLRSLHFAIKNYTESNKNEDHLLSGPVSIMTRKVEPHWHDSRQGRDAGFL